MPRPLFRNRGSALALGVVLFVAGSYCIYDAYEGRGLALPRLLRPFSWW